MTPFQEWLDAYRRELGLTLEVLAERCRLPYSTLRSWIRVPRGEWTVQQLQTLAEGLGIEWADMQRQYIRLHLGWDLEELSTESDDILVVAVKPIQDPQQRRQLLAMVREYRRASE